MKNRIASVLLATSVVLQAAQLPALAKSNEAKEPPAPGVVQTMHGYVSKSVDLDPIAATIDEAMSTAIQRSAEAQKHAADEHKFSRKLHRALKVTKDVTNYMLCDRGFLPSIEGGNLMLDESPKVHTKESAQYVKQHWLDATDDRVVSDIVELATAIGTYDPERREELTSGAMKSLKEVVGEQTAKHILSELIEWNEKLPPKSSFTTTPWSIKERQQKIQVVVDACLKADPVSQEVVKRVHKYSNKSKLATRGSQVVETTFNAISLSPTFVGPAAQAALLVFFMATGGTEEDKLISEMYLGKRLQSRKQSLQQQATMAIDAYQLGKLTNNNSLVSCSESLIRRLGGPDLYAAVFSNVTPDNTKAAQLPSDSHI